MDSPGAERADVPTPESRIGARVRGKWVIDELLGIGGMACVYAATHSNGRRAALKILHPELAHDAGIRDRFLREGYVGNKIQHPGRVDVLDNDTTDQGEPFLVMELLLGETLDQLWKRSDRRLSIPLAFSIADQLLDFLQACHAVGIVHRDLKPANVFICTADDPKLPIGRVKVLDYGIAQLRDATAEHTRAGTALGTPSYMAPEQARGAGDQLDGRADIFSMGAILYALVTGARLHQGRTNDEALILAATQPAPSVARIDPDLPPKVIALIDKALSWDRRNRYQDAGEMRTAVLDVLGVRERPAIEPLPGVAPPMTVRPAPLGSRPPSSQRSAPPIAESAESAADDEPHVAALRGLFRAVERLLPSVRQYGWSHPETERRLRQLFEETIALLAADPTRVRWTVRPYSFAHADQEVWEPAAPFDGIPYTLFESGIRAMHLTPGITELELRGLIGVVLLDPTRDLPPEDDLGTMLWELGLTHVHAEAVDNFAEGDAAEREAFRAQSDPLEQLAAQAAKAARAEARAMAVSTERSALEREDVVGATLGLDRTHRLALGAQLAMSSPRWTERYIDVLADAYFETRRSGDVDLVTDALRASVGDLIVTRRALVATALHHGLLEVVASRCVPAELGALRLELTDAMFGGEAFDALLSAIAATPRSTPDRAALIAGALPVLEHLGPGELGRVLGALAAAYGTSGVEELREAMLAYVSRVLDGQAQLVAARLPELPAELAHELLAVLGRRQTADAVSALADVAASGDVILRVAAIAQRATSTESLRQELGALAEHARADVRLAALREVAEHNVRELGPWLVRRIEDQTFHALPLDERRALLETLHALHSVRAEAAAIALLSQRAVLRSEARDQSRLVAAQHLADHGDTPTALEALAGASKGWWGTSAELRTLATDGGRAISARIEESTRGTGSSR